MLIRLQSYVNLAPTTREDLGQKAWNEALHVLQTIAEILPSDPLMWHRDGVA